MSKPIPEYTVQKYKLWRRSQRIGLLVVWLMILAALTLYISTARAAAHPLCDYFEAMSKEPNVEVAKWVGYPQGWLNYPQRFDYETFTPLIGESGILTRVVGNERWLWGFRTLHEDNGNHDFCPHVLIVSDAP